MNINEIQSLIKFVAKTGVNEVEIEQDGFKLVIKTNKEEAKGVENTTYIQAPMQAMPQQIQPVAAAPTPVAPAPAAAPSNDNTVDESKYITVKAPMIGTVYRKPNPDADMFVNVGDEIKPGQVICIIEAMKLFNEIESEVSGKIVKILVDDSTPIQYDQPLFLVDPS